MIREYHNTCTTVCPIEGDVECGKGYGARQFGRGTKRNDNVAESTTSHSSRRLAAGDQGHGATKH
jgi:hypothetical protein